MTRASLVAVGEPVILEVTRYRGPNDDVPATVAEIKQTHGGQYFFARDAEGREYTRAAWKERGWRKQRTEEKG